MALCIGLDAHAKECQYVVKDESGIVRETRRIRTTRDELGDLAKRFQGVQVVIEASSVHEWIHDLLVDAGMPVFVCHPRHIKKETGKKNDVHDAAFLVDAYRIGALRPAFVPSKAIRELRALCRRRAYLGQKRTAYKNRAHGLLKKRGIKIHDENAPDVAVDIFAKKNRTALLKSAEPEIDDLVDLIDTLTTKINKLEREIKQHADSYEETRLLQTIPGFGPFVSLAIFSEMGDITRFPTSDHLAAYFGLVPDSWQSGETLVKGPITKRGSTLARWLVGQASWVHVTNAKQSTITKKYVKLSKTKGKKTAIMMVARRLVKTSYAMIKNHEEFKLIG